MLIAPHSLLLTFSFSARLADNDHHRTVGGAKLWLSTQFRPSLEEVDLPVCTVTDEPDTCGPTTPVFRFLHRTWNTRSAKRPVCHAPELAQMCLRWDLVHVVRFSGGNAVHLSRWWRKHSGLFCLTEPEPAWQASKAGLYQLGLGGARS